MVTVRRPEHKAVSRGRDPVNPRGPGGRGAVPRATSTAPIGMTSGPLHAQESLNQDLLSLCQDLPCGRKKNILSVKHQ